MTRPDQWQAVADSFALWFWLRWEAIAAVLPAELFAPVKFLASLRFSL